MQRNEENPNFFNRKPPKKNREQWCTYPNTLNPPNNRNTNNIDGVTKSNNGKNFNKNTECNNYSEKRQNLKLSASFVSSETMKLPLKSNSPIDVNIGLVPYTSRINRNVYNKNQYRHKNRNEEKHQSQFNLIPKGEKINFENRNKAEHYSVKGNTDFNMGVEHQSPLSDHKTDSTMDTLLFSDNFNANSFNSPAKTGDLKKLQLMTAKDFDRDRYARYGIHESEIKDYVRTISFLRCIEHCAEHFIKDKVVLVIRSGIGLLPLFCIRNGHAKHVIALEQSACIEYARRIVKDNLYSHMITFIQSSVHDLKQLPHGLQKVDVILSDFMGDCVLSQGDQMEQVIEARDRFLEPNGLMIPAYVTLFGQLLEQRRAYENRRLRKYKKNKKKVEQSNIEDNDTDSSSDSTCCSWWSDVYGFDMRSKSDIVEDRNLESEEIDKVEWCIMTEPLVTFFDPCKVVSTACLIKEFDMLKCTIAEVRLVQCKNLRLKCVTPYSSTNGGDYAHLLELFMVVDFPNGQAIYNKNVGDQIGFSTSCYSPHTRYRQTGLLLRDQLLVVQGDEFIINEFYMWRGPQQNQVNNPFEKATIYGSSKDRAQHEENLKLRLRYTFKNQFMKAIDRRCAYTLTKQLF